MGVKHGVFSYECTHFAESFCKRRDSICKSFSFKEECKIMMMIIIKIEIKIEKYIDTLCISFT